MVTRRTENYTWLNLSKGLSDSLGEPDLPFPPKMVLAVFVIFGMLLAFVLFVLGMFLKTYKFLLLP